MIKEVGVISNKFNNIKNLDINNNIIYIGEENIEHMKDKHFGTYSLYFCELENILANPDYIGLNPKDDSLEYVKELFNAEIGEYVKVAVRVSGQGRYYARTMYTLNRNKVNNFIKKGKLFDFKNL